MVDGKQKCKRRKVRREGEEWRLRDAPRVRGLKALVWSYYSLSIPGQLVKHLPTPEISLYNLG